MVTIVQICVKKERKKNKSTGALKAQFWIEDIHPY